MQRSIEAILLIILFGLQLFDGYHRINQSNIEAESYGMTNSKLRAEWETSMLADPATGKIPANVKANEEEFLQNLAAQNINNRSADSAVWAWEWVGPKNIGGRTRALQYDVTDANILLAGGASGGIHRSEDGGKSWIKVSNPEHNLAITSLAQNTLAGNEHIWYACTGEMRGGLQIQGNSTYSGNGILKSTDGGKSWTQLKELTNPTPEVIDGTDRAWRIIVSNKNGDVLLANTIGIYKSTDDGDTWKKVLGNSSSNKYTDVIQTRNGSYYASLSGSSISEYGIFRSTDGDSWNKLANSPIPSPVERIVLAVDNQFVGERIYGLATTPGKGKVGYNFLGSAEHHSLYKYTHNSSNPVWVNLSQNLPSGPYQFDDYISQSNYCMDIAVSPHDSNLVVVGGTNLYASTDGFKSDTNTNYIGGYGEKTAIPDFQMYKNHHPDLQTIVFHPTNKNEMLSGSDGGIHQTDDIYAKTVEWNSLNNGYATTQFYALAIDEHKVSNRVMGGLQDNGTLLSVSGASTSNWTLPLSYDGGYCNFAAEDKYVYCSKQLDGLAKIEINAAGERINWTRIDPNTIGNYLFINPNTLDPEDPNTFLLPVRGELWYNRKLNEFTLDGKFDKQDKNWDKITLSPSIQPSAIAVSKAGTKTIYLGGTGGELLKITNPYTNPKTTLLSNKIDGRGYINSIVIDNKDTNRVMVVFSNYNTYSVFITENGGEKWDNISGNLEGTLTPGRPPQLAYLNNGPSVRVGEIVSREGKNTVYFAGTSVGLFKTEVLDSMNTKWVQVGKAELHNNVISDIKYRELDQMMVVSTYGGGVFKTYLNQYVGNKELTDKEELNLSLFPNPCSTQFTIELTEENSGLQYFLYSIKGEMVKTGLLNATSTIVKVDNLSKGSYVLTCGKQQNKPKLSRKVIIR